MAEGLFSKPGMMELFLSRSCPNEADGFNFGCVVCPVVSLEVREAEV